MGCFDFFRFEKDFSFTNNKGDVVIIPAGISEEGTEYQTKDLNSMMRRLFINENNEILEPIYEIITNNEYPKCHPLRYNSKISKYEKINFSGKINIYHYTNDKDYIFDIWVEDGKIYKIEDKCK